jgi:hypothetical protein
VCESRLDRLADQLRRAPALTPDLISKVIPDACTRLPVLSRAGKAARIDRFIEAGAWNDARLVLIELELPAWKLRRLVYEDGEWLCSLSKQRNLPIALDETAGLTDRTRKMGPKVIRKREGRECHNIQTL